MSKRVRPTALCFPLQSPVPAEPRAGTPGLQHNAMPRALAAAKPLGAEGGAREEQGGAGTPQLGHMTRLVALVLSASPAVHAGRVTASPPPLTVLPLLSWPQAGQGRGQEQFDRRPWG